MNPLFFLPAKDKLYGRLVSLALVRQPVKEKENSKFKPEILCLKIGLVSHPSHLIIVTSTCAAVVLNLRDHSAGPPYSDTELDSNSIR